MTAVPPQDLGEGEDARRRSSVVPAPTDEDENLVDRGLIPIWEAPFWKDFWTRVLGKRRNHGS